MRETRTHSFRISAPELRAMMRAYYGDNARIATMPERMTLELEGTTLTVRYDLTVEPTVQHVLRVHGGGE